MSAFFDPSFNGADLLMFLVCIALMVWVCAGETAGDSEEEREG